MKTVIITQIVLGIFTLTSWCKNTYKFIQCDFEPSYKAEALHGIGLVTPIFYITGWLDLGK